MGLKIIFGDIAIYSEMYKGDSKFSAIFFVLFYIIMFFIMFAILIALIGGHYAHMMSRQEIQHMQYNSRIKFILYCWRMYYKIKNDDYTVKEKEIEKQNSVPSSEDVIEKQSTVDDKVENTLLKQVHYPNYKPFNIAHPNLLIPDALLNKILDTSTSFAQYMRYLIENKRLNPIDKPKEREAIEILKKDIAIMDIEYISNVNMQMYNQEINWRCKNAQEILGHNDSEEQKQLDESNKSNELNESNKQNEPNELNKQNEPNELNKQSEPNKLNEPNKSNEPNEAQVNTPKVVYKEAVYSCSNVIQNQLGEQTYSKIISIHDYNNISIEEDKECRCFLRYNDIESRTKMIQAKSNIINAFIDGLKEINHITLLNIKMNTKKEIDSLYKIWQILNYEQYHNIFAISVERRPAANISYFAMIESDEYKSIMALTISDNHRILLGEVSSNGILFEAFWSTLNPLCKTRIWNSSKWESESLDQIFNKEYFTFENITHSELHTIKDAFKEVQKDEKVKKQPFIISKENLWKITDYQEKLQMMIQERNKTEESVIQALLVLTEETNESKNIEGLSSFMLATNAESLYNLKCSAILMLNELYDKERNSQTELNYEISQLKTNMEMASLATYKISKQKSKSSAQIK